MSGAGPAYFSEPLPSVASGARDSEYGDLVDREQDNDEEGDDGSTVLGDPRSTGSSVVDDGEASTVAETGSVGTNDERWLALMRDLEGEEEKAEGGEVVGDISIAELERTRCEAEQSEKEARDQEYRHAIAENGDTSAKNTGADHARHMPDNLSTLLSEGTIQKHDTATGLDDGQPSASSGCPQDVIKVPSPDHKTSQNVGPPQAAGTQDPWLVDKFNQLWNTLTPGLPAASANSASGNNTVGWINTKPVTGSGNVQPHGFPGQIKTDEGVDNGNHISESERIFQAFDPREDVIGILRPKAKGEKNTLGDTVSQVDTKQPKKLGTLQPKEKQIVNLEPLRPVGKVENQFRLLKEERLQRQVLDEKPLLPAKGQLNEPKAFEAGILGESAGTWMAFGDKKPPTQPLPPKVRILANETPLQPNLPAKPNWPVRTSRKPQFTPFSVKTGDLLNDPDLIVQEPTISKGSSENTEAFENEIQQKKSLRFTGVSPPYRNAVTVATQNPRYSPAPMVKGPPPSRPLVSILKPDVSSTSLTIEPKTKAYNHEYIREVVIRNLPKDITYSSLLDQVSGGLLEKVMIDWNVLEARIVFAEPEAAHRFYTKTEQNGFWVHTELPHIRLVGKDGLIQCTLGGFLWTQHSSRMTPSMISGIWDSCVCRCLLISNFPKNITMEKLVGDIAKIFLGSSVKENDIIETAGIKRNLKVSNTGLMASVRFTAIMFAVKAGRELLRTPEYAGIHPYYDRDPCGGLKADPPSVWDQGPGTENVKTEAKQPATQVAQPQANRATQRPVAQRPAGGHRGQPSVLKTGKYSATPTRPPIPQPQRPTRPTIAYEAPSFAGVKKTFAEAAGVAHKVATGPIREHASQTVRQRPPPPSLQQGIPPQKLTFRYNYNNWDAEPEAEVPTPEGAHWNHKEQNLVQEYQQALFKKRRRGSDADKAPIVEKKFEKPKVETSYYDRLVYLTNLPRDLSVTRLLRFVRGGPVEHLILQAPSSQYDTCKAIIIFIHRYSARDYKCYLHSPGLVIAPGHRVAFMEDVNDRRFDGIRLVSSLTIRSEGLTRCLRADMLPKGTTLPEVLGVIEEGMNHSTLEFENAIIDVSPEDKNMVVVILRLVSVGRAVWAAGMLRKHFDGMVLSYDRDPCQGPLTELEEVNVKDEAY